jgi:DNA replication protein DnaC
MPGTFSLSRDGRGNKFRFQVNGYYVADSAGVGKSHLATALCHQAILAGHQTVFITLFDFTAKLAKTKTPFSLIEYYAKVPLLCLD